MHSTYLTPRIIATSTFLLLSFIFSTHLFIFMFGCLLTMLLQPRFTFIPKLTLEQKFEILKNQTKEIEANKNCQKEIEQNTKKNTQFKISKQHFSSFLKTPLEFSAESVTEQTKQRFDFIFNFMKIFGMIFDFLVIHQISEIDFPCDSENPEHKKEIELFQFLAANCKTGQLRLNELKTIAESTLDDFSKNSKNSIDKIKVTKKQFLSIVKNAISDFDSLNKTDLQNQLAQLKLLSENLNVNLKNLIDDFEEFIDHFFIELLTLVNRYFENITEPNSHPSKDIPVPFKSTMTSENVMIHVEKYYNSFRNSYEMMFDKDQTLKNGRKGLNSLVLIMDSFQSTCESAAKSIAKLFEESSGFLMDTTYAGHVRLLFEKIDVNLVTLKYQNKFIKSTENLKPDFPIESLKLSNKILLLFFKLFQVKFNVNFTNVVSSFKSSFTPEIAQRKKSSFYDIHETTPTLIFPSHLSYENTDLQNPKPCFDYLHFINKYIQIVFTESQVNKHFKVI